MPTRLLLIPLTVILAACGGSDEPAEELPLPPAPLAREGIIEGRVGVDGVGPGWRVCAHPVDGGDAYCIEPQAADYRLSLVAGQYHVLAHGTQGSTGAHTASTTCLRDGGVDCSDGTLLEVEVNAESVMPAIDILDFDNARPEWPDAPAR